MSAYKRTREDRDARRTDQRAKRKARLAIGWDAVRSDLLGLFVHLIVQSGRAVLLGTTSDGTVLSVSVYDDGERERYYLRNNADVVEQLVDILSDYSDAAADTLEGAANPSDGEAGSPVP